MGLAAEVRTTKVAEPTGCGAAFFVHSMERHISHRHNCSAHVAVGGIAHHPGHMEVKIAFGERQANRPQAVEILLHERFVDDGLAGCRVVRAEIRAFHEGNLHGVCPTRRNAQKVRQHRAGRRAVYRNEAIPSRAVEEGPSGQSHALDARDGPQMPGHLVPINGRLSLLSDGFQIDNARGGKSEGTIRQMVEGGHKQAGEKKHKETEGALRGDQRMHRTAPRMRIRSAFESARRVHRGSAQRRRQAE